MTIYHVLQSENLRTFNESVFLATSAGIYVESPSLGFFKHPDIKTPAQLRSHLAELKKEGFKIIKTEKTARI